MKMKNILAGVLLAVSCASPALAYKQADVDRPPVPAPAATCGAPSCRMRT